MKEIIVRRNMTLIFQIELCSKSSINSFLEILR